jgi:hypothetical protein
MNSRASINTLISLLAIVAVAMVPAFGKNMRNLNLGHSVSLAGTQLAAGEYLVTWESHSPELTVTFQMGRNIVATAPAKMVERGVKYAVDSVVYNINADGSRTIAEVRIGGTKQAIVFGE